MKHLLYCVELNEFVILDGDAMLRGKNSNLPNFIEPDDFTFILLGRCD